MKIYIALNHAYSFPHFLKLFFCSLSTLHNLSHSLHLVSISIELCSRSRSSETKQLNRARKLGALSSQNCCQTHPYIHSLPQHEADGGLNWSILRSSETSTLTFMAGFCRSGDASWQDLLGQCECCEFGHHDNGKLYKHAFLSDGEDVFGATCSTWWQSRRRCMWCQCKCGLHWGCLLLKPV